MKPTALICRLSVALLCFGAASPLVAADAAAPAADNSAFILTPPAPATPRINGPKIFGVRPDSPFLYTIPATGERPMEFSADHLPRGLKLDSRTGQITGGLKQKGEHLVTLRAKNRLGAAEKQFRIVVGEQIALTPAMGWNSWNCWARAVDQDKVLRSARAMAASGLAQHGWTYINIDDTWQGRRDPKTKALQPNEKFPDMKALADEVHALGLKLGIYSTPWVTSYAKFCGGSAENPEGHWTPLATNQPVIYNKKVMPLAIGRYSFAHQDARQWAAWGIDYLKYDWNPVEMPETAEMAKALRACGRDVVYSLSNDADPKYGPDLARLANSWRTTGDIRDRWSRAVQNAQHGVAEIGFSQDKWAAYAGPGHFNDPDMLVVGHVGWGPKLHPAKLTPDEQYTHISLWCLLSAPLLIGCDLEKLDAFTLNLLGNDEVLAVDQDTLGRQAVSLCAMDNMRVYVKDLDDGAKAVGLFNLGEAKIKITAPWDQLRIDGPQAVRDLWRQTELGRFEKEFAAEVPPHGVVLVKISPVRRP